MQGLLRRENRSIHHLGGDIYWQELHTVGLLSFGSMSSPNLRTQSFGMLLNLLFLEALFPSDRVEAPEVNFTFPPFPANDNNMRLFGDAQFDTHNNSITMNPKSVTMETGTCGMLTYDGKFSLQIGQQGSSVGAIAPFNTSFTFKFTTSPNLKVWDVNSVNTTVANSLSFLLITTPRNPSDAVQTIEARANWAEQAGACKSYTQGDGDYFGVVFGDGNISNEGDPSNNFIGIIDGASGQIFKAGSTHNLCGNQTQCSYLSNGEDFTAWIDFIPPRTLQVRLINGSNVQFKPSLPLLEYSNISLSIPAGDYLILAFLGSSGAENHIQSHELLAWSFYTNVTLETNSSPKKRWIVPLLATTCGFFVLLIFGFFSLWFVNHHHYVAFNYSISPREFLYKELCIATKNFSENEKLGSGGFGTVYKGLFHNPADIVTLAVKRINHESKHAKTTFLAEISSLTQIRHRNVVQLQGWCHEKGQLLLVYDYMPNGSLSEWLHDEYKANKLSLGVRLVILQGLAVALEYLQKDCPQCILHRDIKSSNVLLDASFKARLGDFGLARLIDHQKLDKTTNAAGTIGYMAPEIPHTGKATKESDVYSFGILLLEVVCGRRPLDLKAQEPEDMVLVHSVWCAHEAGRIVSVADPRLFQPCQSVKLTAPHEGERPKNYPSKNQPISSNGEVPEAETSISAIETVNVNDIDGDVGSIMIRNLLHLGLLCCLPNPRARPTMEEVVHILQEIGDIDKAGCVRRNVNMPPVPDSKPLGLYSSLEYSQILDHSL